MAMVMAACIVVAVVITTAGPVGADIIMAGAAAAAIATIGNRTGQRARRSIAALG